MAFDTRSNGLITVDALRSEIGSPTADTREAGAITDEEFRRLIDRHEQSLERALRHRLEKRILQDPQSVASHDVFRRTEIDLEKDGLVAKGYVEEKYFPLTKRDATDGADWYVQDEDLETESIGWFDRRRFKINGKEILVIPNTTDAITVTLPVKKRVRNTMGGDIVERLNSQIKEEAAAMLQSKVQEGERLEQDDQLGMA